MQYRKFGKTNEDVSVLGFGAMRLPTLGDDNKIDIEKATKMMRTAIDNGLTYIDTAYSYHGGMSESFVAGVLKDGYREKVTIATKIPSWHIKTRKDMDKYLDEQLANLGVDCIDFLLLHTLTKDYWDIYKGNDVESFVETAKKEGKIKHIGFSFHDEIDVFKRIVDEFDWDFCMVQYNFMDTNYQAGEEGITYAYDKGLGIAIMEPLRGGALVNNIPDDVQEKWDSLGGAHSVAGWALKYIWDDPRVSIILSGMSDMNQVNDNIKEANSAQVNNLTENEKSVINEIKQIYHSRILVNCTACNYCMPCPFGVDIPKNFMFLNNSSMYQDIPGTKRVYTNFFEDESKSDKCTQCGACEPLCPQNIEIIDQLKQVNETLG